MKLEIEKDRVLEAAEECPLAKSVLKKIFPKAFEAEIKFRVGHIFRISKKWSDGSWSPSQYYILSQVATGVVALISLASGERLKDPIPVKNPKKISLIELDTLTFSSFSNRVEFVDGTINIENARTALIEFKYEYL